MNRARTDALSAIEGVDGWLTEGQATTLFDAAAACPPGGQIVEIGSFQGRSTIVLALGSDPSIRVVAIDPHAGNDRGPQEIDGFAAEAAGDHERFVENLRRAGVADRVTHVRAFSDAAHDRVEGPIDVLYVDGAHRFGPAATDIDRWGAQVRVGGTMLIHDSFSSIGVTGAIVRHLMISRRYRYVGRSRSLATYEVVDHTGTAEVVVNAARQLLQLGWFAKNVVLKVGLTIGLGRVLKAIGRPEPEWPY